MDFGESPKKPPAEELDSLRKQVAQLEEMTVGSASATTARQQASEVTKRAVERIKAEMVAQYGFVPPFFAPVLDVPEILASLWQQMRSSYLKNPIPELTKEKLFARLSRSCPVSYAVLSHSCNLKRLGMHASEILGWLEQPAATAEENLGPYFSRFACAERPMPVWPEPGSPLEEALLHCSIYIFLNAGRSTRCREELLGFLGPGNYAQWTVFLMYVRMHHFWLEAHEEPAQEKDEIIRTHLQALLDEEPRLVPFLESYYEEPPPALTGSTAGLAPSEVESLLPSILEQGPFGIAILDPDYRIMKANKAMCRMLDYEEHDLEALSLPAIIHPQDVGACIHLIDQVLSGARARARVKQRFLKRTREPVWVELTASAVRQEDGSPLYSMAFVEDISEQKQSEEKLLGEKQISEKVLLNSPDGIYAFDRDLVCTLWNPAMERIIGIKKEDAVGRIVFEVLSFLTETGDDKNLLETLRGDSVAALNRPFSVAGTGEEGFCDTYYSPLFNAEGIVSGGIAFVRDVTQHRRAEQGLRATEERYLELFENANDIVYTHDLEGRFTSINKAAERILGYTHAEALRMKASQLVAPEHLEIACKMIERQVAGESPTPYEIEVNCKDGRCVALEINTHIISREGKPVGVQGIARDVTERKKTEEARHQAKQNLEAWVHELEQRTREMTLLSEMGDMLRACLTTEEAYTVIVRVAQQIFPAQVGALYVISAARNLVEAVAVWGDSSLVERVFSPDECWALRRGRVHWVEDASVGLLCKHIHQPPPEGYLCVPMMAQSEALGILLLTQPPNTRLTEAKQRLALAMAEHIGMALSNLKLHETLRSQSIRDPLTGLFNRRFMEESLELELRRAARNRRPLGVIMLEVDNFEATSRSFRENAENTILTEIGGLLQTIIRKEDIACRFGAEKFTIILPQGNMEVAVQRAENLHEMIRNLDIRHRGAHLGHVTVSADIAGFPDHGRTVEALIRAADAALQRAKQEGGDRVITAQ